jgi:hypothetical protein
MNGKPELIVMLTHNDRTVEHAFQVFDQCKHARAAVWGFKEEGLPFAQMKDLFSHMKACGKTTALEVVAYTEAECRKGAELAAACGCDILMGTVFSDSINEFCKQAALKYMPFVGAISGRPSVLTGTLDGMLKEARRYLEKGVYGIDLLGYHYTGDAPALNKGFISQISAPVCLAGSINSYRRLDEVKDAAPRFFTIGSGFFEQKFGGGFQEQIDKVWAYMNQ